MRIYPAYYILGSVLFRADPNAIFFWDTTKREWFYTPRVCEQDLYERGKKVTPDRAAFLAPAAFPEFLVPPLPVKAEWDAKMGTIGMVLAGAVISLAIIGAVSLAALWFPSLALK